MAQAVRETTTETVERVVTEEREVRTFTLTLTEEEARLLRDITGNVTGQGRRRDLSDGIWEALYKAGAPASGYPWDYNGAQCPRLADD